MGAGPSLVRLEYVLPEEIGGETAQLRIFDHRCGGGGILGAATERGQTVARENELRRSRQVREQHQGRTRKRCGVEVHVVNFINFIILHDYVIYLFFFGIEMD